MAIPGQEIKRLLEKYRQGTCTREELALLESWYLQYEENDLPELSEATRKQQADEIWASLPVHEPQPKTIKLWPRLAAAATVLVIICAGLYIYLKPAPQNLFAQKTDKSPVVPGSNKAILTLSSGQKINLTDAGTGSISNQAGTTITKTSDGKVAYAAANNHVTDIVYNTVETPRGGQYQVLLPDGSKVWLNSASSVQFPVSFAGLKERHVTITGEAYFEVVHNAKLPFVVEAGGQLVRDIGTQFNIMSYGDEGPVATTLLEGAVKLTQNNISCVLQTPGQQGKVTNGKLSISTVDAEQVIAWKNGLFLFDNTDLHALMRQLSRWYDVDVVYEQGVVNDVFFGKIERKAPLAKVLKILEAGGVHFKLQNHTLTVIK